MSRMPLRKGSPAGRSTYALLAPDVHRIKIGASKAVEKRIRHIAKVSPTRLVLFGQVARNVEYEIHERIWPERSHGEWFNATDEVISIVAEYMQRIDRPIDVEDRFGPWGFAAAMERVS